MNREELIQTVLGLPPDNYVPGAKMVEANEGAHVIAHADIYWRRVIVHRQTGMVGESTQDASTTLTVAAVQNVCVDPARRGEGWGRALNEACYREVGPHALIDFLATKDESGFFERMGWTRPDPTRHPDFWIAAVRRDAPEWPPGQIVIRRW